MAIINVTTDNSVVQVSNGDTIYVDISGGGTVTIVAAPGANIKNLKIHFVDDTQSDTVIIDLSTFTSYDLHIDIIDYDPTDQVVLMNSTGSSVDPNDPDEYDFTYIGADGASYNGFLRAKDKGEQDFTSKPPPIIICFCEGTLIDTPAGPVPVESLSVGDKVRTRDHGGQPLRWIGCRRFDSLDLARHPQLRPVVFRTGALGPGLPWRDLAVSPQHRMLVTGWRAELNFASPEILAPAVGFINGTSIMRDHGAAEVSYYHLLFDAHEIVTANGVPCESLHAGDMAMMATGGDLQSELALIFPDAPRLENRRTARPVTRRIEAAALSAA